MVPRPLLNLSVSKGSKLDHPIGQPINHSTHREFNAPPTWRGKLGWPVDVEPFRPSDDIGVRHERFTARPSSLGFEGGLLRWSLAPGS